MGFARRLAWLALVFSSGCTSHNSNSHADMTTAMCPAGMKDCVDSATARVCPMDSSGWIAKPCPLGSMCMNGDCSAPNVSAAPCVPGTKVCSGNNSLLCSPTGFGYQVTPCPSSTTCIAGGICFGECPLGIGIRCVDNNTVLGCADGFTLAPSPCPTGSYCVTDNTQPGGPAICAPSECTPDFVNGCNSKCGIQGGPSPSPNSTGYVSTCTNTNTPLGWRWITTQCTVGSCDPQGVDCSINNVTNRRIQEGACVSQCKPGAVRCFGTSSTQTCDSNGNWGAAMPCDAGLVCGTATGSAICGDAVCVSGTAEPQGICVDVGGVSELIPCANGRLAPSPAPCTTGLCIRDSTITNTGTQLPGICAAQCAMGDTRCAPNNQVQGCGSKGLWNSTTTACSSGSCRGFSGANGRPTTVCGVCTPGAFSCVDNSHVQVCDSTGQLGASVACTIGQCVGAFGCVAQCVPGATICVGAVAPTPMPGTQFPGTSGVTTCTANGLNLGINVGNTVGSDPCYGVGGLPLGVICCSSTVSNIGVAGGCRRDQGGNGIGCVTCVGSGGNEVGLVDTRCTDGGGGFPGTAAIQTCNPDNNGWGAAATCSSGNCHIATPTPAPGTDTVPVGYVVSCHNCNGNTCTDLLLSSQGSSCVNAGLGGPMSCGITSDCCADACYVDSVPAPAYCGG
jgi:hypothetical protein